MLLGCPSSCECKEFGENQRKKILVTGEDLLTVPRNLPFNTGAVYVKSKEVTTFTFLLSLLIDLFILAAAGVKLKALVNFNTARVLVLKAMIS